MTTKVIKSKNGYSPYNGDVNVFHHEPKTLPYKNIGDIMTKCTVSCDWMNTCDRYCEESRMINALKKKAGAIGGNAVIITHQWKKDLPYTFHTLETGFVTGVTTTHYLKGKVIRLPDQK